MFPRDLVYNSPEHSKWFIIAFVMLILFWQLYRYRRTALEQFTSTPTLQRLISYRTSSTYWMKSLLICFAWIFLTLALMQPKGHRVLPEEKLEKTEKTTSKQTLKKKAHEIVFVLDSSASMAVTDTRAGKSRLEYSKDIIEEIVNKLQGETVSLYAFTSVVTPLVPETWDYLFFQFRLDDVSINEGDVAGTDFLDSLTWINQEVLSKHPEKLKTIILLSDGGDTTLESLKEKEQQERFAEIKKSVQNSVKDNFRLFVIGIGSEKGAVIPNVTFENQPVTSVLDEKLLQAISSEGNGIYYDGNDYTALTLARILSEIIKKHNVASETVSSYEFGAEEKSKAQVVYDFYFQFPLGLALILLWIAYRLPETEKVSLKSILRGY